MSSSLDPALVAMAGGPAALAAIYVHERSVQQARRRSRVSRHLIFPVGASEREAGAALAGLTGSGPGFEFVLETRAISKGIEHFLHAPAWTAVAASHHFAGAIPGLRVDGADADPRAGQMSTVSMRASVPALSVLASTGAETPSRAILGQLAYLDEGEEVRIYCALRPASPRVPDTVPQGASDRDHHRRLRGRAGEPTFTASGLVHARATSKARAHQLLDGVSQVLSARCVSGRSLRMTHVSGLSLGAMPRTSNRAGVITAAELAGLISWPLGDSPIAQVVRGATRTMLAGREVGRSGVVLFVGRDAGGEREIRLSPAAQQLHMLITGPTGAGKSTQITRTVLGALAAGQSGLVVDPKDGSLVRAIASRVAADDRDRVVILSPGDRDAPIGIDLFAAGDPDARAEAITAALRGIYGAAGAFGVRAERYVPLAIKTLANVEHPNLLLVGRLFTDARFRQQAIAKLSDPILKMAWAAYDDLSPEAQQAQVAAPLDRIMGLLQRPPVRNTLAQPAPRLNLGELWDSGGWLLVDLAPGVVGEGAARLMGALLTWLALSTLEARAGKPAAARVPTNLVFDELQALSDLPTSVERLAERSRAFGGQLVLGTQTVSRLPGPLVDSVLGNVATLLCLRPGAAEAERLARELPGLSAADLAALPPYGVAGRVATGTGAGIVTLTGRTEPLGATTGNLDYIRERSARLYGVPRAELEAATAHQLHGQVMGQEAPKPGVARRKP